MVVELWPDLDADGRFEPSTDDGITPTCTVSTSGGGHYWFYEVDPGRHFVALPQS